MIEPGFTKYADTLHDAKNAPARAEALRAEAHRQLAAADRIGIEAGDAISPADRQRVDEKKRLAESLYGRALAVQTEHRNGLTRVRKLKPAMINTVIGVVVGAEILSIPILLANIYMMCKKGTHRAAAMV